MVCFNTCSCSKNAIKKNQVMVDYISVNESKDNTKDSNRILTEEEAKLKALEILEDYFNIKLYLTEVDCYITYKEPNKVKQYMSEDSIKDAMLYSNANSILQYGMYEINFSMLNEDKQSKTFFIDLEAKNGDLIAFYNDSYFERNDKKSDDVDDTAIQYIRDFVEKTNISNITNIKSITHKTDKYYYYVFEVIDADNLKNKVVLKLNKKGDKILVALVGFSITR